MRRFLLTTLFAVYYVFLPFVMNCGGEDLPYVVENANEQDAAAQGGNTVLENCQAQEFLTTDCVAVITAAEETLAEEEALIRGAWNLMNDLDQCRAQYDAETCATTVSAFLDGLQVCDSESQAAQNLNGLCTDMEDISHDAADLCTEGALDSGFCAAFIVS